MVLLLFSPLYAQHGSEEERPRFEVAQAGQKTVVLLPSNWTAHATDAELTLSTSVKVESAVASDYWAVAYGNNTATFTMMERPGNRTSKFIIRTNSTSPDYIYRLVLNGAEYEGNIRARAPAKETQRFMMWIDLKEEAATAFIPEGWNADLQIIRPYESMTGFVFFARGSDNALVYVFHPFMPLHLVPNESLCDVAELCSGTVSAERVRDMSLGNAPIAVSSLKTPEEYFASEVLPVLRRNLDAYRVTSEQAYYALQYSSTGNSSSSGTGGVNSTEMVPVHDVEYSFEVEGKTIAGRAMMVTRNHTAGDIGIWNGYILGIESSVNTFDMAVQKASVTLLTLRFGEEWLESERRVLYDNVNSTSPLGVVQELMANSTLDDFEVVVPTVAHKMVRTYNDTMIAGYLDRETGRELHLPLFSDSQHWYLADNQLVSTKRMRNTINSTSLHRLF
ncbi:MAG TPA: hypothetical protein VNI77_05765 [Nitrososphaera sp.]|nr:hypothetical protein [Nitrososphaera sp.]